MNILQAIADPNLFAPWFRDGDTWKSWRVFLAALFGLPIEDEPLYAVCTRRNRPEVEPVADGETGLAQDKPGNPAGFAVHARAEALMQEHPQMDYRGAVQQVLSEDQELKVRYAGVR
jgi:hypothetical protein